ncbi:MAG: hypothetical protein OHK0012_21940 [Synechococcales cyanobacterium]
MEDVQEQIMLLRQQVNQLEALVRALPEQMTANIERQSHPVAPVHRSTSLLEESAQGFLLDEELNQSHRHASFDMPLEGQIQRLTAQLTAAYNRIAALEEQLLSQRFFPS